MSIAQLLSVANPFGEEIILTELVWKEIKVKHPEVESLLSEIEQTISHPDFIKESIYDSRATLSYSFQSHLYNGKFVVVVVKTVEKNYVSTIYLTNKPSSKGKVVWMKE